MADPDPREQRELWDRANDPRVRQRAAVKRMVERAMRVRFPFPWRLARSGEHDDIVHVLPMDDPLLHEESEECVCGPVSFLAPNHEDCDHPDIWVHQHHAIDGRPYPNLR